MVYSVLVNVASRMPVWLLVIIMALYEVTFWACHRDYESSISSCRMG